nr:hypothetical protein BdHM001_36070 [Bdellovibrio sp. HM001]
MMNENRNDLQKIDFSLIVMQGTLTFLIVFVAAVDHEASRQFLQKVQIPSVVASLLCVVYFFSRPSGNEGDSQ